jgi:Domain of unknown function (DUF4190)
MTETGPATDPPSPFSREGSEAADRLGDQPSSAPSSEPYEPYPAPPAVDPYAGPSAYAGQYPSAAAYPAADPSAATPPPPGFDPQPTPPYGSDATAAPVPAYGSNPYEYPAYQPSYGGTVAYGVVQVNHPKATTAMVFGILGIVFALMCGIGGLLGIPGIVQGRRARAEIDAEPGRYGGRSQAVAGIVTGVIGVVIAGLVIVFGLLAVIYAVSVNP